MALPKELIEKAKKAIIDFSPEMEGVEPMVETKELSVPVKTAKKIGMKEKPESRKVHTFTFRKDGIAEDGAKIPIVSRITIDEEGNIIKKTGN